MPPGWQAAYDAFSAAGWGGLPCPVEHGGQGFPQALATAVTEIWNAANLSFGLGPLLTQGAIEAIEAVGSDDLKRTYLPNMIAGNWTGTMNLTEPHAGTDLGALKTKADRAADGTFRIKGTKIFITYGDHELTPNIIHLVLARITGAPAGTKGISLFLVPKFLVNADGSLGARNDARPLSLEQKLGIHASPTCVMSYRRERRRHRLSRRRRRQGPGGDVHHDEPGAARRRHAGRRRRRAGDAAGDRLRQHAETGPLVEIAGRRHGADRRAPGCSPQHPHACGR